MRIVLVGLDAGAARLVREGARLTGAAQLDAVSEDEALRAARAGEPPAAAILSERLADPIRLAQSLAAIDAEMAITVLAAPERENELRDALRFAPLVSQNTAVRASGELGQLGVDVVEAGQAALRRRHHQRSIAAAVEQLARPEPAPRLRGEALGRVVESAPIGIITLDASHAVAAWNAYAAEIIGARDDEVIGRPLDEFFPPEERDALEAITRRGAAARPDERPRVLKRARLGEEQWVELSAGPTVSQAGEPGVLLVIDDVTGRIQAERARRRAEQAQAFLAETGALLDASLDPVETLQRIAALAVPARADLCLIDLVTEAGAIEGVAFSAVDEGIARAVEDIRRRYPVDPRGGHPVARVLRSGRAEVLEEMTDATYRKIAQSEDHLALMRRLHYHSAVVAPLAARGKTFGAISLLYLDRERRYSPDDLGILEDVARRAALALDNARLYARERRIAETLQRSLLPEELPHAPRISLAARYEPGEGDVGGDWYDAIPLPGGRLGCVVGDIVGRGIGAAAVMGQLRNAVRVYALERDSAVGVVDAVDRLSDSLGIGEMATLVYLVFDPAQETVEICCAGHPPPLIVAPDGSTRYVTCGRSGPVGIGLAGEHTGDHEPLPAGSTVVMYTDGLIERRGEALDEGLAKLAAAAREGPAEADELAEHLIHALRPGPRGDDVALLVVRADPVADRLRLSFAAEPGSAAEMRAELRRWLGERLPESDLQDVLIACSEACANAVEHAYALRRGRVEVEGELSGGELLLVVRDFGRWRAGGPSGRGRGTQTMRTAMDQVELTTGPSGTEVVLRHRLRSPAPA